MSEKNQGPEIYKSKEELAKIALGCFYDLIDGTADTLYDNENNLLLNQAAQHYAKLLEKADFSAAIVFRRDKRDEDKLEEGEHPGVVIKVPLKDNGGDIYFNIWGGIGRETTDADTRDADTAMRYTHTNRTQYILDKQTSFDLNINDSGGNRLFKSKFFLQRGESIAITQLEIVQGVRKQSLEDGNVISLNERKQKETYAFRQFSTKLDTIKSNAARMTPPRQK